MLTKLCRQENIRSSASTGFLEGPLNGGGGVIIYLHKLG